MKTQVLVTFAAALALAQAGCRKPAQHGYTDDGEKTTTVNAVGGATQGGAHKMSIPIDIAHSSFALLGTNATAYSVSLAGCLSGYSATVNETNLDGVEVYKDDRNCLAKLTSFTAGGITYTNVATGAVDFTTWLAGDTALFASAGGEKIRVKVIAQLGSPIAGTEVVTYNFSELLDATSDVTFGEAQVSDPHLITVQSQEAPHFKVVSATFMGADDTTGAPQFKFKLECVDDPTLASPTSIAMNAGSGARTLCSANDLANVDYKLVKDTFSSVLTITNAETIFSTAGATVTIPGDQYNDGATNQGFNTSVLNGPGGLGTAGNQNMILIVRAGLSYTYYNVDVTTITQ